jgi:hypothetical protein
MADRPYVFRNGVPMQAPEGYALTPAHQAFVRKMSDAETFAAAVEALEQAPLDAWASADLLTGAPWARRYLTSMALLWARGKEGRRLSQRGVRALLTALSGRRPRVGRKGAAPLTPDELVEATECLVRWRSVVHAAWDGPREAMFDVLRLEAVKRFDLSEAHRRQLRALLYRKSTRRHHVALALASWEFGRSVRAAAEVADVVYG